MVFGLKISFLLLINLSIAQNNAFEIVYNVKSNVDKNTTFEPLLKAEQEIDKVEPTIIFNDSVALYKANFKPVSMDEKMALNYFCGCL